MKTEAAFFTVLLAAFSPLHAWDPAGHMLTTQIACGQLTPAAQAAVEASIAAFDQKNQTSYTFVSAACWMDDIRGTQKSYAPWHYINLPFTPDADPKPGGGQPPNVLWGIEYALGILKGQTADPNIDKDQALVILLHLIGDCHQPLHAASRPGDAGGNKVALANLKDPLLEIFPHYANLHFFWDSAYRRGFTEGFAVADYAPPFFPYNQALAGHAAALPLVREKSRELLEKYPPESLDSGGAPADWVRESHQLGYDLGYQKLPGGETANPATLDAAYVEAARECARKRLVQAGARIARTLNAIYPGP
ncbi:MAG TPA: S1/P1 nuclease [Chthoniobacterales bacterium]